MAISKNLLTKLTAVRLESKLVLKMEKIYLIFFNSRYCFEISTILGCLAFLVIQQGEEIKNSGMQSFYRNLVTFKDGVDESVKNIIIAFRSLHNCRGQWVSLNKGWAIPR